ncbi:putative kinesin light chain [Zopfia rhizophila CBS 207.26]|uniref:Putative kinesin light chain n=1 Tax=Zopfia rhizophila CBS 207.26 TaxID=1314779 RepID=A0A6A6DNG6_9PEZI|nr:putative kinesin light chain [Zopfia rhizophila CBS 207.26]
MKRRRLRARDYTVGWICALPIELAAAQEMLDEEDESPTQDSADPGLYTLGHIGDHNVVLACLPAGHTGTQSAATVATRMASKFTSIRFGLMVGIGGGVPSAESDIRLGDVVISQPYLQHGGVVQYDFGKTGAGGHKTRTGWLNAPPAVLLNAVSKLRALHFRGRSNLATYLSAFEQLQNFSRDTAGPDVLFKAAYNHIGGATCKQCSKDKEVKRTPRKDQGVVVHYGTIASGNQVIKDGITRDKISMELGGVMCFEMEAAGLMNDFGCLVIRGICDYADSHKNKKWQPYAAATAAACAKEILSVIPAIEVAKTAAVNGANCNQSEHMIQLRATSQTDALWIVHFQRNPRFVGRASEIAQINAMLSSSIRGERAAIFGLGGIGKTQIALEFAHQLRERQPDYSVFWIPVTNVESMLEAYLEIGKQLQIPNIEQEQGNVQKLVQRHLSQESSGKWLLVFDNADDIAIWTDKVDHTTSSGRPIDCLPKSKYGSILFTTRSRKAAVKLAGKNVVLVGEMDDTTTKDLLKKSLVDQDLLNDDRATADLLQKLTHLPLAVVQAAAYINENQITFSEYIVLLDDTEQNIIDILSEEFEDEGRYKDTKNPITTTWLISFEQIRTRDPLAAEYLSFMSCVEAKDIPQSLLPPAQSSKMAVDAMGTLSAYSFITKHKTDQLLDLHRLVHLATRNWLRTEGSLRQWTAKALNRLEEMFPDSNHRNRSVWRMYLPHARYSLETKLDTDVVFDKTALLWKFRKCARRDRRYKEAEKAFAQVMQTRKRKLGAEHPSTLTSIANLASTYRNQGRWKEAEELEVQVMETRKRVLGAEHPSMLSSIANLASTYRNQGRWKEAEELEVQMMETRKRVLGLEHPDTLTSMNNLALTLKSKSRNKEAISLMKTCFQLRKQILGPHHPYTETSLEALNEWQMENIEIGF